MLLSITIKHYTLFNPQDNSGIFDNKFFLIQGWLLNHLFEFFG